jgi:tRNA dimethylallyltransferase
VNGGVLLLTGETASGKSELAVEIAEVFDAEIVGADSRQIYREMQIGTAAPSALLRARVPHYLVERLDPHEPYSAARYVADALRAIQGIHARGKRVVVVGGTGFYVRALCGDVDLGPEVDAEARRRMRREIAFHDADFLHAWLRLRDPRRAAQLAPADRYRVTRALESVLAPAREGRGEPHESLRSRGIPHLKVWMQSERSHLLERIERRVDAMLAAGFIEEAERIGPDAVAANAVGYPHALAYCAGQCSEGELRASMIRVTTRYAKRQATWLRSEPGIVAVAGDVDRRAAVFRLAEKMLY